MSGMIMNPASIIHKLQRKPVALGLIVSTTLLAGLLLHEAILDRLPMILGDQALLQSLETAVISSLLTGYLVGAFYAVRRNTSSTLEELKSAWKADPDTPKAASPGKIGKWGYVALGIVGALLAAIMYYATTEPAWDWSVWEPETWWHRLLGLFIGWWFTWFATAVAESSERISRLASHVVSVDLLDQSPWFPSVKHGLLTALLTIGAVSISSLYLVDPEVLPGVAIVLGMCLPLALVAFLLPIHGVHRRIKEAKESEIEWIRNRIQETGTLMRKSPSDIQPGQMADMIAYLELVKRPPNGPFRPQPSCDCCSTY
jgi:hypothetical protein